MAKSALELVNRCYEQTNCLISVLDLKETFIEFVFGPYQDQIVSSHGLEFFYKHLDEIELTNCRVDFDRAVENWYRKECEEKSVVAGYHDVLFDMVKDTVAQYHSSTRDQLVRDVTKVLTSPSGFFHRWKKGQREENDFPTYFRYLMRLGIRSLADIGTLVDMWLLEQPQAFNKMQQQLFGKPPRRGRPNNVELAQLQDLVSKLKPHLTHQERERLRKIYYYHRKTLSMVEMVEKFKKYLWSKDRENDTQVG
ncbi:hypothetical protein NDK47_01080 [Brevibacillus ruminantium]|uniref:Uncharacterized protein n=1 Tax=Brevibacillus ruminantium TaxID=2950604 RepID=A0ABY4WMB6_9BACL|nr:hypothetical protein [Brevibacillus ruminantium]USG68301.1 hypothetical protein NDK47_01080 [Brevibacillus ruminantium]